MAGVGPFRSRSDAASVTLRHAWNTAIGSAAACRGFQNAAVARSCAALE